MTPELVAFAGLVAIFAVSMWRGINMGAVGLVASFVLGLLYFDVDVETVLAGFPGNLFVTLVGVTFLFGIVRANGTIELIIREAVSLVRGRIALVPWVFFMLAALITGIGAVTAATNAILVPVALAFAYKYRINPLLLGICVLNGTNAGGFSPISVYYTIVSGTLESSGIAVSAGAVFALTFAANTLLNIVAFWFLGGRDLIRRGRETDPDASGTNTASSPGADSSGGSIIGSGTAVQTVEQTTIRWGTMQVLTVGSIIAIVVLALVWSLDVGFMALTAAVLLAGLDPDRSKAAASQIGWNTILLIGGMVTYIGVLESAGVVERLSQTVTGLGTPAVAALAILFIGGTISAFASTNAMFVLLVPLAAPLLVAGQLDTLGFVVALCIASSAVDSSPFSTGGALVVANSEEPDRDRVLKGLMIWAGAMMLAAPLLSWIAFVALWP